MNCMADRALPSARSQGRRRSRVEFGRTDVKFPPGSHREPSIDEYGDSETRPPERDRASDKSCRTRSRPSARPGSTKCVIELATSMASSQQELARSEMFDSNALCLILTLLSRLAHVVCSCAPNRFDLFKSCVARRNVSSEDFYGLKSGSWAISALATRSGGT